MLRGERLRLSTPGARKSAVPAYRDSITTAALLYATGAGAELLASAGKDKIALTVRVILNPTPTKALAFEW